MPELPPSPRPRALITGAGGFIGSALLAPMAEYFDVSAGARRARPDPRPGVQIVTCDLDDAAQVRAAVEGVDLVIHAAYGDEAAMPRQAATLLAAMTQAGVGSLLAFSSVAIYGAREGRIVETDAPEGPLAPYALAKARSEELYRGWSAGAVSRRVIALRPGIVYGSRSPFWIEKMAARITSGGWGVFPRAIGRAALIHIDDLAEQALAASRLLTGPERETLAAFCALNAVGPEAPLWNDYFQALAKQLGHAPLREWSDSETALRQALAVPAKIARKIGLPFGKALALAPTPGEIGIFALDADYRGEAAERLLKVAPRIGLREGLSRCEL
jgi:nucleoside-diphosphate-sugar epimerase